MTKKYIIFNLTELSKIDYYQIDQKSESDLKYSSDRKKTFISFSSPEPLFISTLLTKSQTYSYDDMVSILLTHEWWTLGGEKILI